MLGAVLGDVLGASWGSGTLADGFRFASQNVLESMLVAALDPSWGCFAAVLVVRSSAFRSRQLHVGPLLAPRRDQGGSKTPPARAPGRSQRGLVSAPGCNGARHRLRRLPLRVKLDPGANLLRSLTLSLAVADVSPKFSDFLRPS